MNEKNLKRCSRYMTNTPSKCSMILSRFFFIFKIFVQLLKKRITNENYKKRNSPYFRSIIETTLFIGKHN